MQITSAAKDKWKNLPCGKPRRTVAEGRVLPGLLVFRLWNPCSDRKTNSEAPFLPPPSPHVCSVETVFFLDSKNHPLPFIEHPTYGGWPVYGEGVLGLPNNHRWHGDRGRLSALTPLLVHQIQIAVHPSYLIWGETIRAVVICGIERGSL